MILPRARLIVMIHVYFAYGAITEPPNALSACPGTTLTLAWDFDEKPKLDIAVWYKNGDQIGTLQSSSAFATITSGFTHKVKYVQSGTIKLLNISQTDAGLYRFAVSYVVSSGLPSSQSDVKVTVKEPPVVPNSTMISGTDEMICSTPYLGSPAVNVQIKVNNVLQQSARAIASTEQTIDCCVTGEAVTCLAVNTDRYTTYCHNVQVAVTTIKGPNAGGATEPDGGLGGGVIAIIVLAPLVLFAVVVGVVFYYFYYKRRKR